MDLTTFLAIWGAVILTIVFGWDIYKWKTSGHPKLNIFVNGNMASTVLSRLKLLCTINF